VKACNLEVKVVRSISLGVAQKQHNRLLKSIKCELITFYAANAARQGKLDAIRNSLRRRKIDTIPLQAVLDHRYFDLDTDAYGAFVLEAKVMDTIGAPGTSTSLANQLHSVTGSSQTFTVTPNLSSQGTYDMNYNFANQQDGRPSTIAGESEADNSFHCYSTAVDNEHYDDLAQGKYPEIEQFRRITVNGDLPLAAWLQVNTTIMGVPRIRHAVEEQEALLRGE